MHRFLAEKQQIHILVFLYRDQLPHSNYQNFLIINLSYLSTKMLMLMFEFCKPGGILLIPHLVSIQFNKTRLVKIRVYSRFSHFLKIQFTFLPQDKCQTIDWFGVYTVIKIFYITKV
jgi:hypothetical protein